MSKAYVPASIISNILLPACQAAPFVFRPQIIVVALLCKQFRAGNRGLGSCFNQIRASVSARGLRIATMDPKTLKRLGVLKLDRGTLSQEHFFQSNHHQSLRFLHPPQQADPSLCHTVPELLPLYVHFWPAALLVTLLCSKRLQPVHSGLGIHQSSPMLVRLCA